MDFGGHGSQPRTFRCASVNLVEGRLGVVSQIQCDGLGRHGRVAFVHAPAAELLAGSLEQALAASRRISSSELAAEVPTEAVVLRLLGHRSFAKWDASPRMFDVHANDDAFVLERWCRAREAGGKIPDGVPVSRPLSTPLIEIAAEVLAELNAPLVGAQKPSASRARRA